MKRSLVVLVICLCYVFPAFSQTTTSTQTNNLHFGFAATFEKNSAVYSDGFHRRTEFGFSKLLLPVIYKSFLKIQAEIGFNGQTYRDLTYHLWQYGIGIYYCFSKKKIRYYVGPRMGFEKLRSFVYSNSDDKIKTTTYKDLGLTTGAEFLFNRHFSCGTEIQFNRYYYKISNGFTIENVHLAIVPSLYLTFYF